MEIILVVVGFVLLIAMTSLYMHLLDEDKVKPHVPSHVQRGNFWDAETKKFYKWDELMELHDRRKQNDTTQ